MGLNLGIKDKRLALCLTAAWHKIDAAVEQAKTARAHGAEVTVTISETTADLARQTDDGGTSLISRVTAATGRPPLTTLRAAERTGPGKLYDLVIVAPCTGNTLAKLANAITDGAVPMTVKAHLRNQRPVLISISTNDALGLNARNLGTLLNTRHVYFVPFGQDNPREKPNSLDADLNLLLPAAVAALSDHQLQPMLIQRHTNS